MQSELKACLLRPKAEDLHGHRIGGLRAVRRASTPMVEGRVTDAVDHVVAVAEDEATTELNHHADRLQELRYLELGRDPGHDLGGARSCSPRTRWRSCRPSTRRRWPRRMGCFEEVMLPSYRVITRWPISCGKRAHQEKQRGGGRHDAGVEGARSPRRSPRGGTRSSWRRRHPTATATPVMVQ